MYTGSIIDAHQHFWQPESNNYPWLTKDCLIPFRYGDYSSIKRRYLPDNYLTDAGRHKIVASVYMEAEWRPDQPLAETRYIHQIASQYHYPNAMIAQAWLNQPDIASMLAAQAAWPLVRGVRHKPTATQSLQAVQHEQRSLMCDDQWRQGYALLEKHHLHFELQTPWWYLNEARELAYDFPNTLIIINHCGLPADRSPTGLTAWHKAMAYLANAENIAVKISGLGQANETWTVDNNRWIVTETIAMFGSERCMFASNFPVDSLCVHLSNLWHGFKIIVSHLPESAQVALFFTNAQRIYAIDPASIAYNEQHYQDRLPHSDE